MTNQKRKVKGIKMGTYTEVYYNSWRGNKMVTEKILGSFFLKSDAVKNAKLALSNLPNCGDLFGNDGYMKNRDEITDYNWSVVEDSSDSFGEEGGVILKVEDAKMQYVKITKVSLDQPIQKLRAEGSLTKMILIVARFQPSSVGSNNE